ncbi:L-seryl-tRNA(Sec) selenium transferase [Polynucleobacter kasalickyi]|uniref:L-seryl-tRNA(Sec) selenium transferase n=1 Tax=Polynucleobacter kasalickyi TaxID=1938817 RepID=A0A1W1YA82_9BURK|nr:L-seryl-tRNA(Sec) selenium transferase [Polynucleobacter kasalickyi]SMC33049.1 L-seryl-tRNA(Sec) selenium transferase [Polynucleobacter kasalickyi]
MMNASNQTSENRMAKLPSVDYLIQQSAEKFQSIYGLPELTKVIRLVLQEVRQTLLNEASTANFVDADYLQRIEKKLTQRAEKKVKAVLNLTGTVLHTNLGRAVLPKEAVDALTLAASEACILEYDLGEGKRGDRDQLIEELLCELTGAEAATVVNNNAAAVFLLLHALSEKKETIISRGELIEIGGSFRIPDIMKRAGAKLVEVGTTNRTHAKDFVEAITPKTAMIMKVHTSNYAVQGFTAHVEDDVLGRIATEHDISYVVDLGSGSLVDMSIYGLPKEPTPMDALQSGAHLVTFSGDKLLGGPQCGMIVGSRDLIHKIKKNPLKRMLRVSKLTLAALEAVLHLYRNPAKLPERLVVLGQLTRPRAEILTQTLRLVTSVRSIVETKGLTIDALEVMSQIGSGSLPVDLLPSCAIVISGGNKNSQKLVVRLEKLLRKSTVPVIGRMKDQQLILDLRCLREDQEEILIAAIHHAVLNLS